MAGLLTGSCSGHALPQFRDSSDRYGKKQSLAIPGLESKRKPSSTTCTVGFRKRTAHQGTYDVQTGFRARGRIVLCLDGRTRPGRYAGKDSPRKADKARDRRVRPTPRNPDICVKYPIVVEGRNDERAILRAVSAPQGVHYLGGAFQANITGKGLAFKPEVLAQLKALKESCGQLIVFSDPDAAGKAMRDSMENNLGPLLHAFVSSVDCTANHATKYHKKGNVGVEHASRQALVHALSNLRGAEYGRREVTVDDLIELGLAEAFGAKPSSRWHAAGGVSNRRKMVGCHLGFGPATGKAFLKNANLYGFTRKDIELAIATLPSPTNMACGENIEPGSK